MSNTKESSASAPLHAMTGEQFDNHLLPLIGRNSDTKSARALRLMLVDGLREVDAAEKAEISQGALGKISAKAYEVMGHVEGLFSPAVRMPKKRARSPNKPKPQDAGNPVSTP